MKDVILTMECPFCGQEHEVEVSEQSYVDYLLGDLAQIAFDYLDAIQREQIISHICPECQKKFFGF
jgi:predicted RNA-binding Zn-ribbon protein involved in translation (DUF1610 family)